MKKILATILVLALAAALPLTALAQIDLVNEDIKITADKAAAAPVIDGKLDADSYGKIPATVNDFLVNGADDYDSFISSNLPDAYISYDANNVYVFLSGTSENYFCDHTADTAGDIWGQSVIQISLATADASGTDRLEIGLARNSTTGEQISNIWAQGSDSNGADEYVMVQDQNFAIALDGGKLNYEVAIPWTTFLPAAPKAGDTFGLNFIYGWYPSETRTFAEYSAGCANSKDASLFSKVTLTENVLQAAPVIVADEPAAVEPAAADAGETAVVTTTTTAPAAKTGDTGMLIFVAVMIISAASVVIFRKKTAK